jgi:hypothetical protein
MAKIDSGAGTGTIGEETGITRNVKGEGPFPYKAIWCEVGKNKGFPPYSG